MKKEISVKKNFIMNIIAQFIIYAIPLITTPYVSRVLGAENIGEYSYAISIVTYFTVFATLGSTMFGQRKIAFCREDEKELNTSFWNIVSFRLITTILASCLYIVYILTVDGFTLIKFIVILNIINVVIDISWYYQGIEDFRQTLLRGIIIKFAGFAGIFLFVHSKNDTWKYALILLGTTFVGNLALWRGIFKQIGKPGYITPFFDIKDMWLIFLPTIASQVYMVLDKSMIGWITKSNYSNGCYEQSEKLVRTALILTSAVTSVVLPRVANLYKKGEYEKLNYYVYMAYRIVWLMATPIMLGLIAVADIFIPIYLGSGYEMAVILLYIFAFLLIPVSLASVTGLAYLVPTNQQNVYTFSVSIAAVCNLVINLILIPRLGAVGAAIASVFAEVVGLSIQILYCVGKKQLEIKKIFQPARKYIIASSIMYVVILLLKRLINWTTTGLIIIILIGILCYGSILLLVRDELIVNLLNKFLNVIGQKKNMF